MVRTVRGLLAVVAVLGVATTPACASSSLDAALRDARSDLGAPGVQATIVRDGRVVWQGTSGLADRGTRLRVGRQTRFVTASTAKTVTTAMVLRLAEEGRLSLDDRLSVTYPDLPGAARISVRMLLDHTSGYGDYPAAFEDLAARQPYRQWRRADILRYVRLLSAPGTRRRYSNLALVVAGGVIERAAGATIESTFQRLIGEPLGLRASSWRWRSIRPPLIARSYYQQSRRRLEGAWPSRGLVSTDTWGEVWTDGGLATTATDLARFANALYVGDLLQPTTRAGLLRLRDGVGTGTFSARVGGRRWVGHDGNYGGYESEHWTDVGRGLTIAVMTNASEPDTADYGISDTIWRRLARAYGQRR